MIKSLSDLHGQTCDESDALEGAYVLRSAQIWPPAWPPEEISGATSFQGWRVRLCLRTTYNGRREIRTLGTVSSTHAFQACALNHSATRPNINFLPTGTIPRPQREPERTGRDSNSRYRCRYASFRDWCLQPLGHLSNLSNTNRVTKVTQTRSNFLCAGRISSIVRCQTSVKVSERRWRMTKITFAPPTG